MSVSRSIAGVVIGYFVFAVSAVVLFQVSGHRPHAYASVAFMIGTAIYGMTFAACGGWLAARLAASRPALHGVLVALLIATGAIVSLMFSGAAARWSQWEALILMAPMALLGSLLNDAAARRPR